YHLSYSYQVPGVYDAFKKAAGEITGSGGLGEVILSGKDFNKVKLKIIADSHQGEHLFSSESERYSELRDAVF
ncbi:MAG: hypothetical protein Q7J82_03405, partial [Coriobacteriia bacterium]|nr:hypothetical protein [Coriobacteriia bacterium]